MVASIQTYHRAIEGKFLAGTSYEWRCDETIPFNELILSWNARRPLHRGTFHLFVSLKIGEWSAWRHYASWGNKGQCGGNSKLEGLFTIDQDLVEICNQQYATGFSIKIEAEAEASLNDVHALHVCISRPNELVLPKNILINSSLELAVPSLSQMTLNHPFHAHMCSATSTTAVLNFLLKRKTLDVVEFALKARDEAFDIFGNWVLNVAQASTVLGEDWHCWVQRFNDFAELLLRLKANTPVVVSVRGPLMGSAQPYMQGHLVVVRGYDAQNKRVLCMDPAFPCAERALVDYALPDFLEAWLRRKNVGYVFEGKKKP